VRATLEFTFPEDGEAHRMAVQAPEAFAALEEMREWLRGKVKYGDLPDDVAAAFREAIDFLLSSLADRGIEL